MAIDQLWQSKGVGLWEKWAIPSCLILTTALSSVLIVSDLRQWIIYGSWYESSFAIITSKRAVIQSGIQLIAYLLALIQTSTLAILIQHGSRLAIFKNAESTTRSITGWISLGLQRIQWDLRFHFLFAVLVFCALGPIFSALWVGAMTPVGSVIIVQEQITVPSFKNTTLIKEYPSEISRSGLSVTTKQGFFTYSVGVKLLASLIASGSSATTSDGSTRRHPKIDNTQFIYEGRSYGVGSSVGIGDRAISNRSSALRYRFQEAGYTSHVECLYNRSTDFGISTASTPRIFAVTGFLPDSVESGEYSEYIGHDTGPIVAVGVAHSQKSPRRYISIAAGKSYLTLNATQCTIDFTPTLFNVSVGIEARNITVTPVGEVQDFDPQRNLTRTVVRQFELISNDLTSFYESVLGNAFLSSISAWNMSSNQNGTISEGDATLSGLENAITAMVDSMLAAYGAAQLVVSNFTEVRPADMTLGVFAIGEKTYIITVAVLNGLVVLAVVIESLRTKGWAGLHPFDFSDPVWLTTASFRGGQLSRGSDDMIEQETKPFFRKRNFFSAYSPMVQNDKSDDMIVEIIPAQRGNDEVALNIRRY